MITGLKASEWNVCFCWTASVYLWQIQPPANQYLGNLCAYTEQNVHYSLNKIMTIYKAFILHSVLLSHFFSVQRTPLNIIVTQIHWQRVLSIFVCLKKSLHLDF